MLVPGDPRFDEMLELAHVATSSTLNELQRSRWRSLCAGMLGALQSAGMVSERRRAVRGTASLQVSVLSPEPLSGTAVTSSVSAGGLALRSTAAARIGQPIELSITVPERREAVVVEGEVVWSRPGEIGLQLPRLPEVERELLEAVAVKAILVYAALD